MTRAGSTYVPVAFAALPGWAADDHLAAFGAYLLSCRRLVMSAARSGSKVDIRDAEVRLRLATCEAALSLAGTIRTAAEARQFFERQFQPHRVVHAAPTGLLTAYYEPIIDGSRKPTARFSAAVLRRPADLVNLVDESQRGAVGAKHTHARKAAAGLVPYFTRAEIDQGALKGQGLELLYLADPVDVFFLQIQGSGRIRLPDGAMIRVSYDGKNGHPYTSIGRHLIDTNIIDASKMSLQALATWLKADRVRGQQAMWHNKSYVFFRELTGEQAHAPLGVMDIPLTTGRSMAVDVSHHPLGTPIYVAAPAITHAGDRGGFHRLMIAQDVGSAIRGPERGDLFFGSGDEAARVAGVTKHPGNFYALLPVAPATASVNVPETSSRTTGALPGGPNLRPTKP